MRPHCPGRLGVIAVVAFFAAACAGAGVFSSTARFVEDDLHPVRVASLVEDVTVAVASLDTMRLRAPVLATARTSLHDLAATPAATVPVLALLLLGVAASFVSPAAFRRAGATVGARAPPAARRA
jgi:hypothetical protein